MRRFACEAWFFLCKFRSWVLSVRSLRIGFGPKFLLFLAFIGVVCFVLLVFMGLNFYVNGLDLRDMSYIVVTFFIGACSIFADSLRLKLEFHFSSSCSWTVKLTWPLGTLGISHLLIRI